MPTFTTVAWETLLEPRVRDSHKFTVDSRSPVSRSENDGGDDNRRDARKIGARNHIYISPALYITPEPTPIPESSSDSASPSPYVVNHKRRGGGRGGRQVASRSIDGFEVPQQKKFHDEECENVDSLLELQQKVVDDDGESDAEAVEDRIESSVAGDDFFDPCDSASVASSCEQNDFGKQASSFTVMSNLGDFFDADEEFSDGTLSNMSSSCGPSVELELRAVRLSLLGEIERRKTVEERVSQMYGQWQRIANLLAGAGLTLPMPSNSPDAQLEIDSMDQLSQELNVARFVAEAMGKGQARAEAEIVAEKVLESKDQEISRLRDRLQYYEAVNREMSHRNQEAIGVARKQRQRKKKQTRWLMGSLGLSTAIGASVVAYLYLFQTGEHHQELLSSGDCPNDFRIESSESG